jgi:transposase-like protein
MWERLKERFATHEQARESFQQIIWPKGFICRRCRGTEYRLLKTRDLYVCRHCKTQHSLTAGTIMAGTRIPYYKWAIVLFLAHMTDLDITEESARLGVSERTLRRWLTRIRGHALTPGPTLRRALMDFLRTPNPQSSTK